jgi:hypothetical protein
VVEDVDGQTHCSGVGHAERAGHVSGRTDLKEEIKSKRVRKSQDSTSDGREKKNECA